MGHRDGQESIGPIGPVLSRSRRVDIESLPTLDVAAGPRIAWIEPEGPAILGWGETAVVEVDGSNRFATVREWADRLFESIEYAQGPGAVAPDVARPKLFGGFAFHEGPTQAAEWRGFPGGRFVLPRVQVVLSERDAWVTVTADDTAGEADLDRAFEDVTGRLNRVLDRPKSPPGIRGVRRTPTKPEWESQVRSTLDRIDTGDLEKVVLAQTLTARLRDPFHLSDTFRRLHEAYPGCYRFVHDPGDGAVFFGATPERLISRRGPLLRTEALAGSIARGDTAAEDDRLARALVDSAKVRHEHDLVVDALGDQLEAHTTSVDVGTASILKLANVHHLETPIDAELAEPTHVLTLADELHPTPAVGGLPREAARRHIERTEQFDRGWYAAPVGWFDADGNGTFAVGIRSAVATESAVTLYAGNGIVSDSDPDDEWHELQLKYRPILDQLR